MRTYIVSCLYLYLYMHTLFQCIHVYTYRYTYTYPHIHIGISIVYETARIAQYIIVIIVLIVKIIHGDDEGNDHGDERMYLMSVEGQKERTIMVMMTKTRKKLCSTPTWRWVCENFACRKVIVVGDVSWWYHRRIILRWSDSNGETTWASTTRGNR